MSDLYPANPVNPALSPERVREILDSSWGIDGELTALASMQDQNYRVDAADGPVAVVKVAGSHTSREALDLQNAAMARVHAQAPHLNGPVAIATTDGRLDVEVDGHCVRLLSWIAGVPMSERAYLSRRDLAGLGALAAGVSVALDGLAHPGLDVPNVWDVRHADRVLSECRLALSEAWAEPLDDARALFATVGSKASLPTSVVHGDVTPVNAVCSPSDDLDSLPYGVLDFGDVTRTWRVSDLAAAAVGAIEHPAVDDALDAALAVLSGYHSVLPLTSDEVAAFWPLLIVRAAVSAAVSQRQADRNPGNWYAAENARTGRRALRMLRDMPQPLADAAVRQRVGLDPVPGADTTLSWFKSQRPVEVVAGRGPEVSILDLSADSDDYALGEWASAEAIRDQATRTAVSIGRYAEARIVGSLAPDRQAPESLHLGADLIVAQGTDVAAPLDATVQHRGGDGVVLELAAPGAPLFLRLSHITPDDGLKAGAAVPAGRRVGHVAAADGLLPPHVHVQLMHDADLPEQGLARHRAAWQALCPDPSRLLPAPAAANARDTADLRREREAVVASPQHLYYDQPPAIVRGWRHHLFDSDGRCYLDMINNIAAVGHSHPAITEAALRQFRRLNTNSRFLYDAMTRYAQRVSELLPPELSSVFLVNSGSEAADLALQLARRFTGRQDVVALAGAYHGWTGAVIDVSTSPMDRPNWRAELPPFVHVAEQPDTYRGVHGADAEAYRSSVRAACDAAAGGPAAFICEPLLGNQGALELPGGYLQGVYADVRAAGGLCIADEVQVGMARTGDTFWAFEHEGVVPDIVFTAKATGNGHPLGVVVCRPDIAAAFDGQTSYFSSTGGGPVSCAIGLAVLDVLRDEDLQRNAKVVGAHIRERLTELSRRHELIGAIHGRGLYQGVDLVLDRDRRTPARYEALAVSERLRQLGVIMQPTGDAFNVLKVKPPMCIDEPSADYFVDALDDVLTNLT